MLNFQAYVQSYHNTNGHSHSQEKIRFHNSMEAPNVSVNFPGGNCQKDFRVANDCLVSEFKATVIRDMRILREGNISSAFLTLRTGDNTELCDAEKIENYLNKDFTMFYAEVRFPLARCGLCTEALQSKRDQTFSPLLLHCGHCICNSCLDTNDALAKKETEASLAIKISCPVCGVQTIMPRNSRLVPSEVMADYSSQLRRSQGANIRNVGEWPRCQGRDCTHQAMWHYPANNLHFCDQCRNNCQIDGECLPFFHPPVEHSCDAHPERAGDYYCLQCLKFCCENCNQHNHRNGTLMALKAAIKNRLEKFNEMSAVVSESASQIDGFQDALREAYDELELRKRQSLEENCAYFNGIIERLKQKQQESNKRIEGQFRQEMLHLVAKMNGNADILTKAIVARDQMDRASCASGRLLSSGCAVLETGPQFVEKFKDEVLKAASVAKQPSPEIAVPICRHEEHVVEDFVAMAVAVPGPPRVVNLAATHVSTHSAQLSWMVEQRGPPVDENHQPLEQDSPITNFLVRLHLGENSNSKAIHEVTVDRRGNENDGEAGRPVMFLLTGLSAGTAYTIEVLTQSVTSEFTLRSPPSAPLSLTTLPFIPAMVFDGLKWSSERKCTSFQLTPDKLTVSQSGYLWHKTGSVCGDKCIEVQGESQTYALAQMKLPKGTNYATAGLCTEKFDCLDPSKELGKSDETWAWDSNNGSVLSTLPGVPSVNEKGNPNHVFGEGDTVGILVNCLKLKPTLQWFLNGEEMGRVDLPEECYGLKLYPAATLFALDSNSLSLVQDGTVPDLEV